MAHGRSKKGKMIMFEKFGEFDSVEELNLAAEGLKKEGDIKSLNALAEENGIDKEDVEDYVDGIISELASVSSAAYGRIDAELKECVKDPIEAMMIRVIADMLKSMCSDKEIAIAVMKKDKRMKKILEKMKSEASKHKSGSMGVSCGTDRQLKEIIRTYYTNEKGLGTVLANLYK